MSKYRGGRAHAHTFEPGIMSLGAERSAGQSGAVARRAGSVRGPGRLSLPRDISRARSEARCTAWARDPAHFVDCAPLQKCRRRTKWGKGRRSNKTRSRRSTSHPVSEAPARGCRASAPGSGSLRPTRCDRRRLFRRQTRTCLSPVIKSRSWDQDLQTLTKKIVPQVKTFPRLLPNKKKSNSFLKRRFRSLQL